MLTIQKIDRPFFGVLLFLAMGVLVLSFSIQNPVLLGPATNDSCSKHGRSESGKLPETTLDSRNGSANADDCLGQDSEKHSSDWWVARFTGYLIFVGVAQALLFLWQLYLIRESLADAKEVASAARESADLARQQFVATHRPKIIVRFIQGPWPNADGAQGVWVTVTNVGETDAIVESFGRDLAMRIGRGGWLPPGVNAGLRRLPQPVTLTSGERLVIWVEATGNDVALDDPQAELCVVGRIQYRNRNGRLLETGFLRVWDRQGNFTPSDNPEDEYQD